MILQIILLKNSIIKALVINIQYLIYKEKIYINIKDF